MFTICAISTDGRSLLIWTIEGRRWTDVGGVRRLLAAGWKATFWEEQG